MQFGVFGIKFENLDANFSEFEFSKNWNVQMKLLFEWEERIDIYESHLLCGHADIHGEPMLTAKDQLI